MVRKQVYIEEHQERWLKASAKALGVTEAELIRQSLERGLGQLTPPRPDPAWARVERFIDRRRAKVRARPAERWTRDDLYDFALSLLA
ncbi:MAG: hypothetical protein ACREKS_01145 [Candidatus Rokuibacteriota bacterium]